MSSISIDNNIRREKMRHLLNLLSLGRLDRENAENLRALLNEELSTNGHENDIEHQKELRALIKILDKYIAGEVNLMLQVDNIFVSNVT